MIVRFSKNPIVRSFGVIYYSRGALLFFITCAVAAYYFCVELEIEELILPIIPVSVLGGALAIFLGFRNGSAYDRWWEARKVWGGVVNDSRALSMEVITYCTAKNGDEEKLKTWVNSTIHRHIGWVYALRSHLRKETYCKELQKWISEAEQGKYKNASNIPAQVLLQQGKAISYAFEQGWIEEFRFNALISTVKKLYDNQGKAERIKNTVFPFYYNYYTRFFLTLFTLFLPFTLAGVMSSWILIPISVTISFAFHVLNKTGVATETPFEGRAADTPLSTICRGIEIDLLEMIESNEIPEKLAESKGRFGVIYHS